MPTLFSTLQEIDALLADFVQLLSPTQRLHNNKIRGARLRSGGTRVGRWEERAFPARFRFPSPQAPRAYFSPLPVSERTKKKKRKKKWLEASAEERGADV